MSMCVKGVDVVRSSGWWRHRRRVGMGGRWIYDCKLRVTSMFVNGSVFLLCVYVTEDECCLYGYNSGFTYIQRVGVGVVVSHGSFIRLMREGWHKNGISIRSWAMG